LCATVIFSLGCLRASIILSLWSLSASVIFMLGCLGASVIFSLGCLCSSVIPLWLYIFLVLAVSSLWSLCFPCIRRSAVWSSSIRVLVSIIVTHANIRVELTLVFRGNHTVRVTVTLYGPSAGVPRSLRITSIIYRRQDWCFFARIRTSSGINAGAGVDACA